MNTNELNNKIAELRKTSGLTQEALAAKLGVSYQAVSKWENGLSCPDVLLLPKIADIFGISIDSLFGIDKPRNEKAASLPWTDDNSFYIAVFRGHTLLSDEQVIDSFRDQDLRFRWDGDTENVSCPMNIHIEGNVYGDVSAGFGVECGNVGGSVTAGSGVGCDSVAGNVIAGGSVSCDDIYGSVKAGGNVACDCIHGETDGVRIHIDADGKSERVDSIKKNAEEIEKNALDLADRTLKSVGDALRNIFK